MQADTEVMQLQSKECQGFLAASHQKLEEAKNGVSFRASGRSAALSTPSFQISGLQNCKRINFYCFKPPNVR